MALSLRIKGHVHKSTKDYTRKFNLEEELSNYYEEKEMFVLTRTVWRITSDGLMPLKSSPAMVSMAKSLLEKQLDMSGFEYIPEDDYYTNKEDHPMVSYSIKSVDLLK